MGTGNRRAIVVGSGPNGLVAAVTLARAGVAVSVLEAANVPGGGTRSADLSNSECVHDICSAVHPIAVLSPAFRELGLDKAGVQFVHAPIPLAHPLPDGDAAVLDRSLEHTCAELDNDAEAWRRLMRPFLSEDFFPSILQPIWWSRSGWCRQACFGLVGLRSCASLVRTRFRNVRARALFAGCAAHSLLGLDRPGTASFGMVLALSAHQVGWPCVRGGSYEITRALVKMLEAAGGTVETGRRVTSLRELAESDAVLFDINPKQVADICGTQLPGRYRNRLARFPVGPGIFKVDWVLDGPIPWLNPHCSQAMTVHVGGTYEEVVRAESEVACGIPAEKPFVLVAQQSLFDSSRSSGGKHTGWAYCHVPNGCEADMTGRIEAQMERFAPGFRERIIARHTTSPRQLHLHNLAMPGGDIGGGSNNLLNFLFRPAPRWNPYTTPNPRLFLCSSSTPPGGGVHGMCGFLAAQAVLKCLVRSKEGRLAPNANTD